MRKESTTIQKCNSRLTALGLNSDAAFHRSKLILKIYRDVVWVLSERAEELQETAWIMGEQDIESGLCYLENFAPDIELQAFSFRNSPRLSRASNSVSCSSHQFCQVSGVSRPSTKSRSFSVNDSLFMGVHALSPPSLPHYSVAQSSFIFGISILSIH